MKDLKKKFLCSLMAAATAGSVLPAMAKVPADVEGTGFEEPIQVLAALGVMVGDGNGEFRPKDNLTRAEVAKIAVAVEYPFMGYNKIVKPVLCFNFI